jgi:D-alanyl-D-alanine carboxypeptidase/D-alanyl-D-alanine-endopeptidase (penicillin-binding protein 4)
MRVLPKTTVVKIINKTVTVPEDGKKKLKIQREHETNTILVEGTIPVNSKKYQEWIAVREPTRFALDLFYQSLTSHGIKLNGKTKISKAPKNTQLITTYYSMPLSQLLIPFMKLSNNGHAETLIKEMGKVKKGKGSWKKGLAVCETELAKFGINPKTMVLRDGSGVSHVDLVPANQITQLLYNIQGEKWFPAYLHALPIAGETEKIQGGTLRNRLKDPTVRGKVKAKTGTISTVSALSGYVDTKSGQRLIFSILLNNLLDEDNGKKIEDKIVTILANQ